MLFLQVGEFAHGANGGEGGSTAATIQGGQRGGRSRDSGKVQIQKEGSGAMKGSRMAERRKAAARL
jgi:hypothetical protein